METQFFVYLSAVEGFMIVGMLGWEIFWLRRMYQALQSMPTSQQLAQMVEMLKHDRDAIVSALTSIINTFEPIKGLLNGSMLGSLFSVSNKTKVIKE
jgi:hypothetical protein